MRGCWFVALLIALLVLLHQDYWNWHRRDLVADALPATLVWHMGVSLLAAAAWYLATLLCWPREEDQEPQPEGKPQP